MKPKEIPDNFIVQINTITELGELCTILRDNGWRQRDGILYRETGCVMRIDRKNRMAIFRTRRDEEDIEILTLAEFKERYSNLPKSVGLKTETKPTEDMETKEEKSEIPIFLCEQYPLDPQKAWQKWQEEQKRYTLSIAHVGNDLESESAVMFFHTPADRDKCIEEIKGIIDKYSEK